MRMFHLHRIEDETGISGTGIPAEGVEFNDRSVALRWTTAWPTSVVFHDRGIESVEAIHCHGDKTQIVWVPPHHTTNGDTIPTFTDNDLAVIRRALETQERVMTERGAHPAAQAAHNLRATLG